MKLIDIHNHCTYGIDDGAETLRECEECLLQAYQDGIGTIVATPHLIPYEHKKTEIDTMKSRMEEVKRIAENIGIHYYFGSEMLLNGSYMEMLEDHRLQTLADSDYILVEFDVMKKLGTSYEVEDRLYEIIIAGYKPLVAHAERYFREKADIARVRQWVEMGCLIQVNRTSILGLHSRNTKNNAMALLNEGLVHVVASDAHSSEGSRTAVLSDAYEFVSKKYGGETAKILFVRNPEHIIRNEMCENITKKTKRNWFGKGAGK